jgi:hypothetical protein
MPAVPEGGRLPRARLLHVEAVGMSSKDVDVSAVNARLVDAAEHGQTIELILVVRGRVRPVRGTEGRRWRMRIDRDHVLTFRADTVVAATPLPAPSNEPSGSED